jgi:NAD dependent epimerase/dehydratase family
VNLVRHLQHSGRLVRTVGRRPLGGDDHTVADIRERDKLRPAFEGAAIVFHLAAKITLARVDPEAWDINVRGPAAVAASALDAGVQRLVHCSSVHAFDLARSHPVPNEYSHAAYTATTRLAKQRPGPPTCPGETHLNWALRLYSADTTRADNDSCLSLQDCPGWSRSRLHPLVVGAGGGGGSRRPPCLPSLARSAPCSGLRVDRRRRCR